MGYDWLFINTYNFKVDDQVFNIIPDYGEFKRNNGEGKIWEWVDLYVGDKGQNYEEVVRAIASAKKVKVRFVGSQSHDEKTMSEREQKAMKNILEVYDAVLADY